jgi:hypothetical protein
VLVVMLHAQVFACSAPSAAVMLSCHTAHWQQTMLCWQVPLWFEHVAHQLLLCLPVWLCLPCDMQGTSAEKSFAVQRYILDAARVSHAQQQKELRPGTEKGLQALTQELFMASGVSQLLHTGPTAGTYVLTASCVTDPALGSSDPGLDGASA